MPAVTLNQGRAVALAMAVFVLGGPGLAQQPRLTVDAIFDPATVGSMGRPERRYDLPGGAKRMVMRSQGIEYTVVNGAVTWESGKLTGATSGKVLRS